LGDPEVGRSSGEDPSGKNNDIAFGLGLTTYLSGVVYVVVYFFLRARAVYFGVPVTLISVSPTEFASLAMLLVVVIGTVPLFFAAAFAYVTYKIVLPWPWLSPLRGWLSEQRRGLSEKLTKGFKWLDPVAIFVTIFATLIVVGSVYQWRWLVAVAPVVVLGGLCIPLLFVAIFALQTRLIGSKTVRAFRRHILLFSWLAGLGAYEVGTVTATDHVEFPIVDDTRASEYQGYVMLWTTSDVVVLASVDAEKSGFCYGRKYVMLKLDGEHSVLAWHDSSKDSRRLGPLHRCY
jgi:hypothetical protein